MSLKICIIVAVVCTAWCDLLGGGKKGGGLGGLTGGIPIAGKQMKMLDKPMQTVQGAAGKTPAGGIQKKVGDTMGDAPDIQKAAAPVGLDLSGDKNKFKNKNKAPKGKKTTTTTTPEPEEDEGGDDDDNGDDDD